MKKFKLKSTLLCVLLLITLLCSSLTGCGNEKPNNTQSTSTESESELSTDSEIDSEKENVTDTSSETESEKESESETLPDNSGNNNTGSNNAGNNNGNNTDNNNTGNNNTGNSNTSNNNTGNNNTGNSNTGNNNTGNNNTGNNNTGNSNTGSNTGNNTSGTTTDFKTPGISLSQIPAYSDNYYIALNNNKPHFSTDNLSTTAFEFYSELDSLGRCGVAYACLGPELLPTETRGDINSVTPSGWVSTDSGNSLYNRSHLIAHSLAGENDNPKNLITGTSRMNQYSMQVFEDQVLDYIKETGNHVMYRVTPFFEGNNLVATGVQMEGWSVEDNGEDICFNVFIYNVQDNISIDYATGESHEIEVTVIPDWANYMVHKTSGKIHEIDCSSVLQTGANNRVFFATWEEALEYSLSVSNSESKRECGNCHAYSEHK